MSKRIYSKKEMMELGYSKELLIRLAASEHLSEYGYRLGKGRTSKLFFILPKVERFIECQMDDYGEVIG